MSKFLLISIEEILANVGDTLARWFFTVIKWIFNLMDTFMDIIFQLAGLKDAEGMGSNILTRFFSSDSSANSNAIANLYFYTCLVCVVLMIFLAVISIIKQDFFSEEPAKSHAPIFKRMVTGVIYFIAIPPIFIFSVEIVAGLMSALMQIESVAQLTSLSQAIFELSLTVPEWMKVEGIKLDPIPHWSVVSSSDFAALTKTYDFNLLVFLGVVGMSFYSMFMLAFGLVKRIFNLVLLYVLGPIAISQSVLDGGSKMKNWTSSVIKEFTSVFGTVVGLVVFSMFVTEVVMDLELFKVGGVTGIARTGAILGNTVVKAMFILVGFSAIRGNNSFISNAIGSNLSISDGENAYGDMKKAIQYAQAPFKAPGKALNSIGKTMGNISKKAKGAVVGIGRNLNGGVWKERFQKMRPTLDAFRSEEQLEKIKAERKTIEEANKKFKEKPNDDSLRRIANPDKMKTHISGEVGRFVGNTNTSQDNSKISVTSLNSVQTEEIYDSSRRKIGDIRHTDLSNVQNSLNAISDASNNYDSTIENQYKTAKQQIKLAIQTETQLMETEVGKAETELIRLIAGGASQRRIQQEQEKIQQIKQQIKQTYNVRISKLTQVQENIEKTETKHKAVTEVRKAQTALDDAGSNLSKTDTTGRRAAAVKEAAKADEALKKANDAFK